MCRKNLRTESMVYEKRKSGKCTISEPKEEIQEHPNQALALPPRESHLAPSETHGSKTWPRPMKMKIFRSYMYNQERERQTEQIKLLVI